MKLLILFCLCGAFAARADALNWQVTVPTGGYDANTAIVSRMIENGVTVPGSQTSLAGPFNAGATVNVIGADSFQASGRTLCAGVTVKQLTSGSASSDPANPQVIRAPSPEVTGGCAKFLPAYLPPSVSGPR